jgi:uncharacterized protein (TIRG00374 family)
VVGCRGGGGDSLLHLLLRPAASGLAGYAAANVIALVPITPGGLGIVEASLGGLLILAGVRGSDAFLATLAYRLASYWLPLSAGLPAYMLFRHHYGRGASRPARTHP